MLNDKTVQDIVSQITYKPNWSIKIGGSFDSALYLQIQVKDGICSVTGDTVDWAGGKKYLSPYMCKQEIVGACFAIIKSAELHELREFFRYKGASIYNPHLCPDALAEIAAKKENFVCRPDNQSMEMKEDSVTRGDTCKKCGSGTYQETSPMSDINGEYTCNNCGHVAYS